MSLRHNKYCIKLNFSIYISMGSEPVLIDQLTIKKARLIRICNPNVFG